MIFIFSYNREEMLKSLLSELKDYDPVIIDDGSSFTMDNPNFISLPHQGKKGFWKNWKHALEMYKNHEDDFVLFLPDDVTNVNMDVILQYHERFKDKPYVFNVLTDHRNSCWNLIRPTNIDEDIERIGFVDCAFFANRFVFDMIGYDMKDVGKRRFRRKSISSGVGQQLTNRIISEKIPIYRNRKSLVYHGDHPSLMHDEERKKNPLISK
jgi:hypothetical protein